MKTHSFFFILTVATILGTATTTQATTPPSMSNTSTQTDQTALQAAAAAQATTSRFLQPNPASSTGITGRLKQGANNLTAKTYDVATNMITQTILLTVFMCVKEALNHDETEAAKKSLLIAQKKLINAQDNVFVCEQRIQALKAQLSSAPAEEKECINQEIEKLEKEHLVSLKNYLKEKLSQKSKIESQFIELASKKA